MDHPASLELVRPWRTATLVATAIAVLELLLLIGAGMILLGKSLAPHGHAAHRAAASKPKPAAARKEAHAKPKPHRPARVAPKLSRAQTHVIVLNGNGLQGAASTEAALVEARGYRIAKVGNAARLGYAKTLVMYRPGFAGDARRFALELNHGLVRPLDGMKPAQLHGAQLVVILGASR